MIGPLLFPERAGSLVGLPFLLLLVLLLHFNSSLVAEERAVLTFQVFESSCIDLGHYDRKLQRLTVRFVNRETDRFYCYLNVRPELWSKLQKLNETGGVGNFLNEAIVQHPDKFPFEELTIRKYKTVSAKTKKAGNSK